ncbi:low molecular weight protein-tyrosine-phosphatase [Halalkalibacillus halophilus]|uniref:low molecular weight protein-tyrosine-phosphatase n=1 Tax=Halalkalibacillus halophilus TaxID=392827 RepID=UPI000481CC4D|nr:low molecular weight protein-tyrosine-phosphatase [Halalkalibacillus halophilus]
MVKVLFVCLGNICRSPMAEAVFQQLVSDKGLDDKFVVDSAGTADYHVGEAPHEGTIQKLKEHGIATTGLMGRQVSIDDFTHFDYIVPMDEDNIHELRRLETLESNARLKKLLDYVPGTTVNEIPDPYLTGDFEETYALVSEACKFLLDDIRSENDL